MQRPDIYESIDALGSVSFSGLIYRHLAPTYDCRSGEGARVAGGRWNSRNSFPVIYAALTPEVAAAEFLRLAQRNARAPNDLLPRTLCSLRVELESVLDLRSSASLQAVGLSLELIQGNDPTACQAVGQATHKLGLEGILAPSATGAGEILGIFSLNLQASSSIELSETTAWTTLADLPLPPSPSQR